MARIKKFFYKIVQKYYRLRTDFLYQKYIYKYYPRKSELINQIKQAKIFNYKPKISIITPVYDPDPDYLIQCIRSVENQTYLNWELCLVDDNSQNKKIKKIIADFDKKYPNIKSKIRSVNGHISQASNDALKLASGEFVALLDHDDLLWPNALFEIVSLLNNNREIDFIYTDEDKINKYNFHMEPALKPDFSLDMFLSNNYLCHLSVIRRRLIEKLGNFSLGIEAAQDYDLFLRVIEQTSKIVHIPKVLYSWRKTPKSTAANYQNKSQAGTNSLRVLKSFLKLKKIPAIACNGLMPGTFRIKYPINRNAQIAILPIAPGEVKTKSLAANTELIPYRKHLLENKLIKKNIQADYYLFINPGIINLTNELLEFLLEHAQRQEIGAVCGKLLTPQRKIIAAGWYLDPIKIMVPQALGQDDELTQIFPSLNYKDIIRNYNIFSLDCLMVEAKKFWLCNGFEPVFNLNLKAADLCLKLIEKKLRNLYTPYAEIILTNKSAAVIEPAGEIQKNKFRQKWRNKIRQHYFLNPNLREIFNY